ncbi:MAG: hypothetical protein QM765_41340 [Myxococcales bacterium]
MKPMLATYLLTGAVVAALLWRRVSGRFHEHLGPSAWHLVAWPFFVPALMAALTGPGARGPAEDPVFEVERRLVGATEALARQLGLPLTLECAQVRALAAAMRASARRVETLQRVLLQPEFDGDALAAELERMRSGAAPIVVPLIPVMDARLSHVRQAHTLWQQARADLDLALARAGAGSAPDAPPVRNHRRGDGRHRAGAGGVGKHRPAGQPAPGATRSLSLAGRLHARS